MPPPVPDFHPELVAAARLSPRVVARSWTLPALNLFSPLAYLFDPSEAHTLGPFSVYVYRPAKAAAEPGPALLWIHGGGLVMGDARQDSSLIQRFVDALGIPVCSVQYRLAGAHPFPAPLQDCKAALDWLGAQDEVNPGMIAVLGVSGGGCLAAALSELCREEGGLQPCLQVLVYPMLDDRSSDAPHPNASAYRFWDQDSNRLGWDTYLRGLDRQVLAPYAVPARAKSLKGLPPTWIGVGTLDLFHAEVLAYAERLELDGVSTQLHCVEGAFHAFDKVAPEATVTQDFYESQINAVGNQLRALGWQG